MVTLVRLLRILLFVCVGACGKADQDKNMPPTAAPLDTSGQAPVPPKPAAVIVSPFSRGPSPTTVVCARDFTGCFPGIWTAIIDTKAALELDGTRKRICMQTREGVSDCRFNGRKQRWTSNAIRIVIGGTVPERTPLPREDLYWDDDYLSGNLCTLDATGHVRCDDDTWQGTFHDVDASHDQACGLRTDGRILCQHMSRNLVAATLSGPDLMFKKLAVGDGFVCGIDMTDRVRCWGIKQVQDTVPVNARFRSLSAGNRHACGVTLEGKTACWGDNSLGQAAAPNDSFEEVAAIDDHSCAITSAGEARCWGSPEK